MRLPSTDSALGDVSIDGSLHFVPASLGRVTRLVTIPVLYKFDEQLGAFRLKETYFACFSANSSVLRFKEAALPACCSWHPALQLSAFRLEGTAGCIPVEGSLLRLLFSKLVWVHSG